MPRGDGTGPSGMGPMTGRAAGYCAGQGAPGFMNPIPGRGFGGGGRGGGGRGRRNQFYATGLYGWQRATAGGPAYGSPAAYAGPYAPAVTRDQELDALKAQAEYFRNALETIGKRIDELRDTAGKTAE